MTQQNSTILRDVGCSLYNNFLPIFVVAFLLFAIFGVCGPHSEAAYAQTTSASPYVSGTDITAQLTADIANSTGGLHQGQVGVNEAVITLPGGLFKISSTVNLHNSTLVGAGSAHTIIEATADFGAGSVMFAGDVSGGHPFEIDGCTIEGPRPPNGVASGTCPNQMDGVHLYDDCILRKDTVNYFNRGVIVDGNHHTLDTVNSGSNWDGIYYPVSSDNSYMDDLIFDCSFCSNGNAGIEIASNSKMGGVLCERTHTGFEPYSILLGHNSSIGGCTFDICQFEGPGNADIADLDGSSEIGANDFTECSGWGGEYNNDIPSEPRSPVMRVGTLNYNIFNAHAMMGPAPGGFTCTQGCYGNTWNCDGSWLEPMEEGTLTPPVAPISNCYDNVLNLGSIRAVSFIAQTLITVGQPVQFGTGRYPCVVPSTGNAPLVGVALQTTPAGSICWVAQHGIVNVALDPAANIVTGQQVAIQSEKALPEPISTATGVTQQVVGYAVGYETPTTHFLSISTAPVEISF